MVKNAERDCKLQRFSSDLLEACKEAYKVLLDPNLDHQEAVDILGGVIEAIEGPDAECLKEGGR